MHLPNMRRIFRDFEAEDFMSVMSAARVGRTLLVQTECTALETQQLLERARRHSFVAGVVGWVDFDDDRAADRVATLALDPLVRGVRLWLAGRSEMRPLHRSEALAAFAAARRAGLALEVLARPEQLDAFLALADAIGDGTSLVVGHAAKPAIGRWDAGSAAFLHWRSGMQALAQGGAAVKLSGLVTELGDDWEPDVLRPYWDVLAEEFGPARMMWGSDWPVIDRAGGYAKWLAAVRTMTADWTQEERAALFGGTACTVYGLPEC